MGKDLDKKITNPIARRLREARIAAGISQKKLGIAAGLDEFSASARMNQYETGKHNPDFLTLGRVARVLGIPTAFFYTADDDLAKIIAKYGKLSKAEKVKLNKLLDSL
jgi:transcriptional regulator with XRE-family HTH domain